ncbi:MAG: 30S ribosomal protein S4e [Sulfolobales archaeon]|nr:30S ribosomal protein S4e [Sulfolobales archaeon]MCX8208874.1 30S ribosomal protein S4e [Sulfolobales archaeon]MDW8010711.1 30S ribosomal protein S4e [Sulfolobales archaeon]
MGSRRHLKRLAVPGFWPLLRKEAKWAVKPAPGPHPISRALPLLMIVRDIMGYAKTYREARRLIAEGHFKIDGRVRRDYKFPVGLMDTIEVVDTGEFFRVVPVPVKIMTLVPISKDEASFKLCRIENKTTLRGGRFQLNLHDGKNVVVDPDEAKKLTTMSVVKVSIPDYKLLGHIPLDRGVLVAVIGGMNTGRVGRVVSISEGMRHYRKLVLIEDISGGNFYTSLDKVLAVGVEKPEIALPVTMVLGGLK